MSNLYIPILNPLQFVDVTPTQDLSLYATKHIDDFLYEEQIYKFQNKIPFLQQWVSGDIIKLQFESDYAPIQLDMVDQYGRIITGKSAVATQVRANKYLPGMYVYEASLSLTGLGAGPYRYLLTPANTLAKQQKSEWFTIIPNPYGTLLLTYYNSTFQGDVLFETGIQFTIRVPGYIEYMAPGNKMVVYENQPLNQTLLSGRRFRNIALHIGDGSGVPPWMIDKINASLTCDNWLLDSKPFAVVDGKWTEAADPDMILKGFTANLREGLNRSSKIVTGTGNPNLKVTVVNNIDGRLFGDVSANSGETVIQILDQQ